MDNKTRSDRIFELLPKLLGAKTDENWSGLVSAIGSEDDRLAQLIEDVRNQFFVKTASRPYLDRLAANSGVTRPKFVGMGDATFQSFVPVLSYQPKQVKQIIDRLLDLFFLKEATTAFLSSAAYSPFVLEDGWDLQLQVDNINLETITFRAADFSSIGAATADEVVAAYNRQANYTFATNFFDSNTRQNYVRIFTNTLGTQGALQIVSGLANIGLQLNGFMPTLGGSSNTQWNVTKVGDAVTFTYTGGGLPGIDQLQEGDLFLCDLPGNKGSFPITSVNIQSASFQFSNLLATAGSVTQTSSSQTKFLRPEKFTAYKTVRRALTWETGSGITVEMPATPTIVQRDIKGGFHINGMVSAINAVNSSTSLTLASVAGFPAVGSFVIEPASAITDAQTSDVHTSNGRLISQLTRYSYTSISGTTLQGITPDLPATASLHQVTVSSLSKTGGVVTCTASNDFRIGENVIIRGSTGISVISTTATTTSGSPILTSAADLTGVAPGQLITGTGIPANTEVSSLLSSSSVLMSQNATATSPGNAVTFSENTNGSFSILSASSTVFTYGQLGQNGTATGTITASVERADLAPSTSRVISTTASVATGILGPYVWDPKASFVLSADTITSSTAIQAGKTAKLLTLTSANSLPETGGMIVLDYGQNHQEGPIRYLYKANNILALDPSYVFQFNHDAGYSVTGVSHRGPHQMSGTGAEYAPYITNPAQAREILQELITSVASAGIFIDFLIRYPTQLYGTLSVYD
jgi:hypothetical protein